MKKTGLTGHFMDLFYRFSYEGKMNNICYFCDMTWAQADIPSVVTPKRAFHPEGSKALFLDSYWSTPGFSLLPSLFWSRLKLSTLCLNAFSFRS